MFFDWTVLSRYWPDLLLGLLNTFWIVLIVLGLGAVIGLLIASLNLSEKRWAAIVGRAYVNCFRNIPEMVLIFWVYFCLPQLINVNLSALLTGVLALALAAGANLGEIFRAGIQAVPKGQREGAMALGLSAIPLWGCVVLPQALRQMLAPIVNYTTELLKQSTLLSVIGVMEVAHSAFTLGGQTFRYLEFFTAIGVFFFLIIFPFSVFARHLMHSRGRLAR
ncbi:amino acid ABC transporter permease [Microvirga massiliensis]|uniref:amino acid ABC transporter permease n=1 Tax=Microvirga massiliensis TaxID=1033741 RepID=UPI00062BEDF3|nr:amino acid ABC transporter permease [Microvirga massiliensis]